jgi:Spy/CpxP family protein refolding chaperone
MKKHIASFLVASSAAFGLSTHALAQEHPGRHGGPMMELRSLDLTPDQQAQVKKIFEEQKGAMRTQMEQQRSAHEELRKLSAAETFDASRARQLADQEGKAHAELALIGAQAMSKVRAVLTPEQRTKLDQQLQAHAGRGHK